MREGYFYEISFTTFNNESLKIPPIEIIFQERNTQHSLFSEEKIVRIFELFVTDSTKFQDIKDIHREAKKWFDYPQIFWAIGLILAAAAAFLLYKYQKNKKNRRNTPGPSIPNFWEIALRNIDFLEKKELWQAGKIKDFHSELSEILREYLSDRYQIRAFRKTNSEILAELKNHRELSPSDILELSQLFRTIDLVKFARAEPPDDFHVQSLEGARDWILKTYQKRTQVIDNQLVMPHENSFVLSESELLSPVFLEKREDFATAKVRFAAAVIDFFVWSAGSVFVLQQTNFLLEEMNFRDDGGAGTAAQALIFIFGQLIFTWFFHVILEKNGFTPGKLAFQIRALDESGRNMTIAQAMRRFVAKCNFLHWRWSDLNQITEHDHAAQSKVVRKKIRLF
jgi:hypothetical protein